MITNVITNMATPTIPAIIRDIITSPIGTSSTTGQPLALLGLYDMEELGSEDDATYKEITSETASFSTISEAFPLEIKIVALI